MERERSLTFTTSRTSIKALLRGNVQHHTNSDKRPQKKTTFSYRQKKLYRASLNQSAIDNSAAKTYEWDESPSKSPHTGISV